MSNLYADMVEQIILEMKENLPEKEELVVSHEYFMWLDFLKKIKPKSTLFIASTDSHKEYDDLREIMLVAENSHYPTWYIQPHCGDSLLSLIYEKGELQKVDSALEIDLSEVWAVPRHIPEFSGIVKGILNDKHSFVAYDLNTPINFLQKMELLKNYGFTPCEYVLFPTDKIMSITSSTLEASLLNFISKSHAAGLPVDGVVMVSDIPLAPGNYTHIIFKPKSLNSN
ncbi:MAG: hypothetical protein WCW16_05340 [Candidatus Magasanikbacteria bacterium]